MARLITLLEKEHSVSNARIEEMRDQAAEFAREQAESAWSDGHDPQGSDALTHLFSVPQPIPDMKPMTEGPRLTMQQAIGKVLADEMERDSTILVFGEDVGAFGGVHRVTDGLQTRFGEERCFDTSLNEEGIVGRSVGMAVN